MVFADFGVQGNLSAIAIAIAAFVSTNLDDLFLLTSLFVDSAFRTKSIVAGQFLGMSFLVIISVLAALFAIEIPSRWICLLGLAPLLLGINRLLKLVRRMSQNGLPSGNRPDFVGKEQVWLRSVRSQVGLVTLLTVANGGDNLSVYIPLFSIEQALIPFYALVFAVMTALWCFFGACLTSHRLIGRKIKQFGRSIIPFVLIGIGVKVLSHA